MLVLNTSGHCDLVGSSPIPTTEYNTNRHGDNTDNRLENLILLCPNCHALTDTYRAKNRKK